MRLAEKLRPELVLIAPDVAGRDDLFRLFGDLFEREGLVRSGDEVVTRLLEREAILSTGIGGAAPSAVLTLLDDRGRSTSSRRHSIWRRGARNTVATDTRTGSSAAPPVR